MLEFYVHRHAGSPFAAAIRYNGLMQKYFSPMGLGDTRLLQANASIVGIPTVDRR